MPPRKRIPKGVETQVLVQSLRRCCLCVFLDHNADRRKGQVAHLDKNPANADPDNLVFLCFDHHEEYDSRTSQGENFTAGEVKEFRRRLFQIVAKEDVAITFPRTSPEEKETTSSGRLLGLILDASDRELDNLDRGARTNGILLYHLAIIAATEHGDFTAAEESFLSLIRLAGKSDARPSLNPPVTTADLVTAAERTMRTFFATDFGLTLGALHKAREIAILGDAKFAELDVTTHSISPVFFPTVQMLCRLGRSHFDQEQRWSIGLVSSILTQLLMSAGMLLTLQRVPLPLAPQVLHYTGQGERTVPEGADMRTEPFVWAASRIAMLGAPAFEEALKHIEFHMGIAGINVDPDKGYASVDMKRHLYRCAVFPGRALIVGCAVKRAVELEDCELVLRELKTSGTKVVASAKEFITAERELVLRRSKK